MTAPCVSFTAAQLLQVKHPAEIFSADRDTSTQLKRQLAKKWHPDRASQEDQPLYNEVMTHVTMLFTQAEAMWDSGTWDDPRYVKLDTQDGFEISFFKQGVVEIAGFATRYDSVHARYIVAKDNAYLCDLWQKTLTAFNNIPQDEAWKKKFGNYLKYAPKFRKLKDGGYFVSTSIPPGFQTLRSILAVTKVPVEHAAWMMTRLYQEIMFMQQTNTVNLDLSLDSVLVNVDEHTVFLLDGWQYNTGFQRVGDTFVSNKLVAAPARIATMPDVASSKTVDLATVINQAKALVREVLGDRLGVNLLRDPALPSKLVAWLNQPGKRDIFHELEQWYQVINAVFPKREFVKWDLPR